MSTPIANVAYTFDSVTRTWLAPGRPSLLGAFGLTPSLTLTPSATLTPSGA